MGLLGDALESMATCGQGWSSLRADLHWRLDREAESEAGEAVNAAWRTPVPLQPPGSPWIFDVPSGVDERRGELVAVPGAMRLDWHDGDAVMIVRDGEWRRRRRDGTVAGSQPSEHGDGLISMSVRELNLVRPWRLLSYLHLSALDALEWDDRPAIRVRGVPRKADWHRNRFIHGLADAEAYDLVVDKATGVVVERIAWLGDREVERTTLHGLRVGDPLDPGLFDLSAAGAVEDLEPSDRRVLRPLVTMVSEVDFTVFGPRDEVYLGIVDRDDDGLVVTAHPSGGRPMDRLLWFTQSRGARMATPAEWEATELADGTPAWWWSPDTGPEQGHLRFERAGTQIWIQGPDLDEIRDLAARLEPISV